MKLFRVTDHDTMAGRMYYAIRNRDDAETGDYPFRWMAWLAGLLGFYSRT